MKPIRIFSKSLYFWIRELHLYFGLFISPFILMFAVSTILFNHTFKPWDKSNVQETSMSIEIPEGITGGAEGLKPAKQILRQVNVSGEIGYLRYRPKQNRLIIPVMKPGQEVRINVDLEKGTVAISRKRTDIWEAMLYLHKSPGQHNVNIRGNWIYTQIWRWLADIVVYLLLFISASGIYMWTVLKAERKIGLILLGAGGLSLLLIVFAIVA